MKLLSEDEMTLHGLIYGRSYTRYYSVPLCIRDTLSDNFSDHLDNFSDHADKVLDHSDNFLYDCRIRVKFSLT